MGSLNPAANCDKSAIGQLARHHVMVKYNLADPLVISASLSTLVADVGITLSYIVTAVGLLSSFAIKLCVRNIFLKIKTALFNLRFKIRMFVDQGPALIFVTFRDHTNL